MAGLKKPQLLDQLSTKPTYMTTLGRRLLDGRCRSSMDGSVWLYRLVPLAPVVDAKDDDAQLSAMDPLFRAYQEMAKLVSTSSTRRFVAKGSYRRTHTLLINVPEYFHLPWSHPLAGYLNQAFDEETVDRRVLLFGVELRDVIGGGGTKKVRERWRDRIDSLSAFFIDREIPIGDYEEDYRLVDAALDRAGLYRLSDTHFKLADAYWSKGVTPATPTLPHLEHMHVFHDPEAMRQADIIGPENCEHLEALDGQGAVSYASVVDFDFNFDSPLDQKASWVADLVQAEALAVSIRGLVEPQKITRAELRRQTTRYVKDIDERVKQGKMDRAEQQEMLGRLTEVERHYSNNKVNPSLIDTSVLVCFSGIKDLNAYNTADHAVQLAAMTLTQPSAMAETWLCSRVQANPRLHEIPVQVVAASGITSLSRAGDKDGALVGLSELDRQPCMMSSRAASLGDDLPIMVCAAATGAGKTQLLLWLAHQWAQMGESGVIIDPKTKSDHSAAVKNSGGQVIRLDEIASADGIFDPVRFLPDSPDEAISLAASMLMSINPWGRNKIDMEQPLGVALRYGIDAGATCTGQALKIAQAEIAAKLPPDMVSKVLDSVATQAKLSALVGVNPESESLAVKQGITLIMVGNSHLNLPGPGKDPDSIEQRIALALTRMMVFGSSAALAARGGGFVFLDEAWTFLGAGAGEVERLGRLARSQEVLPGLFTQRVSDATKAGLSGYISRVLIGHIRDKTESAAACELSGLDPAKYVDRIRRPGTEAGDSENEVVSDPFSMKPMYEPGTRKVVRGAIYIYKDLAGRAIPVEIKLPDEFLGLSSTNPADIARRREQVAAGAAA